MKLAEIENTFAYRINHDLLSKVTSFTLEEIKQYLLQTIDDPKIGMAKETRVRYRKEVNSMNSLVRMQSYVYNIALKTSGDGVI